MIKGFNIVNYQSSIDGLQEYRNQGALRGRYLGFPLLHEKYTMSLPGCSDWTGIPQCFTKEQLIITDNGSKPISEINVGDKVLSYNHEKDINEYREVTATPKHITKQKIIKIKMKDGTVIKVTENHEFFTGSEYIKIKDLLNNLNK